MEFTELADYPIAAGTLTEWIPSVGPHASTPKSAGWQDDPRPTSYVHEGHLRRTLANPAAGRESWLGTAFRIAGPLDKQAFRRAVLAWIDRHEGMRSNASIDEGSGALSRVTATPGATDIWVIEQDPCFDSDDVYHHLQHLFDEYTTPLAWPSYSFATLEPIAQQPSTQQLNAQRDGFTVFFAADHSIIDGLSVVLVADELTRLYVQETTGLPAALFTTRSYLDFGVAERAANADVGRDHPAVLEWERFLGECGGRLPAFPVELGPAAPVEARAPQSGLSAWILDPSEADAFSVACRKTGHGFFAGLVSTLAAASHATSGAERFRAVTPVHTRIDPSWAASLGWFVGLSPLAIDVYENDSFGDLIARADYEIDRTKPVSRVPLDLVGSALGVQPEPRFVVSYMDARFAPSADAWADIDARALRSRKYDHDVYLWFHRTPQGVNISARFPNTETATAGVHRFIGAVRAVLRGVATTGTFVTTHRIAGDATVTGG